jgi:hypothetical protein
MAFARTPTASLGRFSTAPNQARTPKMTSDGKAGLGVYVAEEWAKAKSRSAGWAGLELDGLVQLLPAGPELCRAIRTSSAVLARVPNHHFRRGYIFSFP